MDCLKKLIDCHFLKNTGKELSQARHMLKSMDANQVKPGFIAGNYTARKKLYNYYVELYGFKEDFDQEDVETPDMIYYLQEDNIVWIASRHKDMIDQSIHDSLHTSGDVCIFRGRHIIHNRLLHTVMFDLSMQFPPVTKN